MQGALGGSRGRVGLRLDQIGDGFGLHQVELVVQECPLGKLARLRGPGAQFERPVDQPLQDERAAVALQLEDVLAGEGLRRRKVEGNTAVDHLAGGIDEIAQGRVTGSRQRPDHLPCDVRYAGTRQPHDTEAAGSPRRGDGADGVSRTRQSCG